MAPMDAQRPEQRLVFGEVADRYDRVRPGYPEALVDDVLAVARAGPGARVLEVGAGTGKATALFAERGVELLCLEPDEAMAAVARRRLDRFPSVRVLTAAFERWQPTDRPFDLLIAAQSWHWVAAGDRVRRAAAVLAPSAWMALWWNRGKLHDRILRAALDAVYRTRAPELTAREPGSNAGRGWRSALDELLRADDFTDPQVRDYNSSVTYPGEEYVDLLATQSDHRMLPPAQLDALLAGVGEVVAQRRVDVVYRCQLLLTQRAGIAASG